MRKGSTLQCALLHFCVPLLLLANFTCATSALATTEVSGNEVNTEGKLVNEELAETSLQGYEEEEKLKGYFPKPISIVKPVPKSIPIVKPIPKLIPVVKPIHIPVYKFVPKLIPTVKPIPIYKPVPKSIPKSIPIGKPISNEEEKFKGFSPKPIPIIKHVPKLIPVVKHIPIPVYKPIPKLVPIVKPIPIVKPVLQPIPVVKPIPKPFIMKKPIPMFEQESFLKPKPFFGKPVPKFPLDPKFKKPLLPPLPIHKPIPTP